MFYYQHCVRRLNFTTPNRGLSFIRREQTNLNYSNCYPDILSTQYYSVQRKLQHGIFWAGWCPLQRNEKWKDLPNHSSNDIQQQVVQRSNAIVQFSICLLN